MVNNSLAEITFSNYSCYEVSVSNNGRQWNTIYCNKDFDKATTILNAFSDVGYRDISNYGNLKK